MGPTCSGTASSTGGCWCRAAVREGRNRSQATGRRVKGPRMGSPGAPVKNPLRKDARRVDWEMENAALY